MSSRTKWRSLTKEEEERSERLRQIREEWRAQQEFYRKHEERKEKYKIEYERNRAEAMKEKKSPDERGSKNSSPQRREISPSEQSTSKETSVTGNGPEGIIIDQEELQRIKIHIYTERLPTKNQSTSDKIERDIINPDDIIVPRRQNEGARPIFQKSKVKETEEIRTITISQNEQLEKQLFTTTKNVHIGRRPDDDTAQHYRSDKKTIRRDDRTDNNDSYNRDRRQSSSIRDSKEKDRSRSERRDRSTSRYGSRSASLSRNRSRSRSRYRSRSHSPISERTKERRIDNDKNKFLSRRNYPDYPPSNNVYQPYVYLPGLMLMSRPPRPMLIPRYPGPVLRPVFPGFPMDVPRWRQPPPRQGNWNQRQGNWNH